MDLLFQVAPSVGPGWMDFGARDGGRKLVIAC